MVHTIPDIPSGVDETAWANTVRSIREYCGWHIGPEVEETVTIDGPGGCLLMLPTQRLVDLSSLTSDGTTVTDPEWSQSGMVRGRRWSSKFRGITVTMTHGYRDWPDELTTLAVNLIGASSRGGATDVTSGPHRVRFEGYLSPSQLETLDRYRLVGIP